MGELYELPDGWEWKDLKEISKFENGDRGKNYPSKSVFVESGIAVISAANLDGWNININGLNYITEDRYNLIGSGKIKKGDVLFCLRGSLGKSGLVINLDKGVIASSLVIVRPSNELNTKLLMYYFNSGLARNFIDKYNNGAAQPNLSAKSLGLFNFPLPPLQEQKRIVSKLDRLFEKIDKAIALHQTNMDETDAFMGSVLNEVFGELEERYEKIDFNSVCNKITDGSHNPPKGIENSNYLMLSSKNVFNNSINFDNPRYLKEEDFNRENKRTDISVGDVLLTIVGTIGRTAVVNIDEKFTLQRSVAVLKPKRDILDSYFLMYSLQKNLAVLTDGAKGAAQKGIYLKSIKQLEIVNLPLETQQKVVDYLDDISQKTEKVKQLQKEKMETLKALKASLLDQAFRGEL